ncbi:replication protein A 32 kDa subunit A [Melia azedarach]|uniref:Replication protein A 32 kDa subunit A n=1 Tax=Melia azedarach TaxID=155640 RepID=A0ACC1XET5_MELAZ|nr:replication protein A 32 kDa subunit A [Melia azedarach]
MYSSEFDGAAAFSGGGFMPSQAAPAPDPSFSSHKNRNVRTLLPMTVKQISEISSNDESSATIDGVDVNTVTIVGLVCSIQDKEPQFVFLIDDGTGQIECGRWAHEQMEFNEVNQISQGMYVRVYGHLKPLQDKRSLNAYCIRPVTDFNEITSHFIECIFVQLYNTRLRGGGSIQPQLTSSNNVISSNQYNIDGGKNIDQMVLNFLRRPDFLANNNGVHRNVIAQQLNLPMDKLMEALESLNENSLVYTLDECHYKSAVNA